MKKNIVLTITVDERPLLALGLEADTYEDAIRFAKSVMDPILAVSDTSEMIVGVEGKL